MAAGAIGPPAGRFLRAAVLRLPPLVHADPCVSLAEALPSLCLVDPVRNTVPAMELGVPKSKITPSRKGKRNGPKFLKPVSVIARCTVCGRVKLPQFFCCNGTKPEGPPEKD